MTLQLGIAYADLAEVRAGLVEAGRVGAALVIRVGKLRRVILPPADFTMGKGSGRLLQES